MLVCCDVLFVEGIYQKVRARVKLTFVPQLWPFVMGSFTFQHLPYNNLWRQKFQLVIAVNHRTYATKLHFELKAEQLITHRPKIVTIFF